jgi:hypothetical protein
MSSRSRSPRTECSGSSCSARVAASWGVDDRSDWDVAVIVTDEVSATRVRERFPSQHGSRVEVFVHTLDQFRELGAFGRSDEWQRYLYAHLTPVVDRTGGELQSILDAKELLPDGLREERAQGRDRRVPQLGVPLAALRVCSRLADSIQRGHQTPRMRTIASSVTAGGRGTRAGRCA